jgi:transposase
MSRFLTIRQFTSWLGVCPGAEIPGGNVMSGKVKRVVNRAAQSLRLAAEGLRSSKSALGAYFRRLFSLIDKPKAVTAAAHKLARLIWTMPTKSQEYANQGHHHYEERSREGLLRALWQCAAKLGCRRSPLHIPPENIIPIQSLGRRFLRTRIAR